MQTIDLNVSGDVATPQITTKATLMAALDCSLSTVKRIIKLLDDSIPDEFARQDRQQFYSLEQAKMIRWVKAQLDQGYRYTHIAQILERGLPDNV